MVRVGYRFRIDPDRLDEFRVAWRDATEHIRATYDGALGSTLLVDADDPTNALLLARWESRDHWQASRDDAPPTPAELVMREIGTFEGVTFYDVIDDLTR